MLTLSIIFCAALSSNAPKGKGGAPFLLAAWKHPEYYLQILGLFLMFWGLFDLSFYVPGYAKSIGLSVDISFYLIAILNAGSFFGRFSGGAVANRIGRLNTLTGATMTCAILIFCWLTVTSRGGMITFSVLFGFFSGTVIGLFPATIALTAIKSNEIGPYMGTALGVWGISTLPGTPISGAMINSYGSYHPAIIFAGVATLVGVTTIFGARAARR